MELEQIGFTFNSEGVVIKTTKSIPKKKPNKQAVKHIDKKYQELYDIYSQLYDLLDIDLFETREIIYINDLIAYPEDRQAEVNGTQFLDLDERIRRNEECLSNMIQETIENTTKETKTLLTSL